MATLIALVLVGTLLFHCARGPRRTSIATIRLTRLKRCEGRRF